MLLRPDKNGGKGIPAKLLNLRFTSLLPGLFNPFGSSRTEQLLAPLSRFSGSAAPAALGPSAKGIFPVTAQMWLIQVGLKGKRVSYPAGIKNWGLNGDLRGAGGGLIPHGDILKKKKFITTIWESGFVHTCRGLAGSRTGQTGTESEPEW